MHHLHPHFVGGQLGQRRHQGLLRTLHVGLDDERQGLRALAQVVEHGLELGGLLARQLDVAELALAEQRDFARLALVGQGDELVAGGRRSEEHTSELQSLMRISYAVFCLKNKKKTSIKTTKQ